MECRVKVTRSFSSQWKERVIGIYVMLSIFGTFFVKSNLSSLSVGRVVGETWGSKYEIGKHGSKGCISIDDEEIRAFAGCSSRGKSCVKRLSLKDGRGVVSS